MSLPKYIPTGARLVIRVLEGRNKDTGRSEFRDYIGHVVSWDGEELVLNRDPAANGSRSAQTVCLRADSILIMKPIPERKQAKRQTDGTQTTD